AERLCVVEIREAETLRDAGVRAPIVYVAATPEEDLENALRHEVIVSVADVGRAQVISALAARLGIIAKVHIAIETGTGWWGVTPSDAHAFATKIAQLPNIEWEGAWTHIAGRDSMDAQLYKLHAGVAALREHGVAVPVLHIGSTGPTVWNLREGAARIGVGLYGASLGDAPQAARLRTALEVRAPVYAIRRYSEPMPLGYGGTYVALPGQTIVTLRIGYGEGMPKALSGRGCVVLSGVQCQIVGAIGMNFTMVAAPPNATLSATDEALIVGDVPGVTLEEVAAAAQTIPHNIVTMFGAGITPLHVTTDGAAQPAAAGTSVQERG
ncbi:MAG: alanine racemase, partial [Candidatus Eremiobacteraeota bacterium]|nr:alanine racemase [Candidatus Eremiobacteraeota bacterium]